jgi:exoribonuclease II
MNTDHAHLLDEIEFKAVFAFDPRTIKAVEQAGSDDGIIEMLNSDDWTIAKAVKHSIKDDELDPDDPEFMEQLKEDIFERQHAIEAHHYDLFPETINNMAEFDDEYAYEYDEDYDDSEE